MKTINLLPLLLFAVFFWGCQEDAEIQPKDYPFVVTKDATQIDSTGATFGAEVLYFGEKEIIDYGFTWKNERSEYSCSIKESKNITDFSFRISSDLENEEVTIYRAYVKTKENTVYGNSVKFISKGSLKPVITDFYPKEAIDGDLITITGSNFSYSKNSIRVLVSHYLAEVLIASADSIVFKVPASELNGENVLRVEVGEVLVTAENKLKIMGPEIESISINQGYSGEYITVTGKNFVKSENESKLLFDYFEAEILSVSDTEIKAIVPPVKISNFDVNFDVNIWVQNGLKSALYPDKFRILSSWEIKNGLYYNAPNSQIFTFNNQAYILEQLQPVIHVYNPKEDNWKKETSSEYPLTTEGSLHIVIDNNMYLVGGNVFGVDQYKELWVFNIESKKWTRKGDLPFSFLTATYSFQNNQTHIITDKGEHWQCDFNNEKYVRINDFPVKFENSFAYSFVSQNNQFTAVYGRTLQYDSLNDIWIEKAGNPIEKGDYSPHAIGFTYKNSGYIYDTEKEFIYRYDALEDRWIKTCYVPVSLYNHPRISIFVLNDRVYFEDVSQNNNAMLAYKN